MASKKKECNYELNINGTIIPYTLVKSSRRRTIAIQIGNSGKMTVRCPYHMCKWIVDGFLREKQDWIYKNYLVAVQSTTIDDNLGNSDDYVNDNLRVPSSKPEDPILVNKHKKYARKIFEAKVAYYQQFTGGNYSSITIRDQKTRWGSCSGRGTLSFNWRLILAPPEILDYVVVHELCHLTHMNHSKEFWNLVGSVIPDYKVRRKWLKEKGHTLRL